MKSVKIKRWREERQESFAANMRRYHSSLAAFGMRLYLEVSKGVDMMISDAAIFNNEDLRCISDWMAASTFLNELINWDKPTELSR